jgi:hypothetical protein
VKVVLLCRQVDDIAAASSDPTVAQGLSEFIVAMLVAKITKYLRSILIENGLPPSGRTLLYKKRRLPSGGTV